MVSAEGGDKTRLNWLMLGKVAPDFKEEAETLGMMNVRAFTSGVWVFPSFVSAGCFDACGPLMLSCNLLLLQGGALW